jgi:ABC-type amino acid transport substrate-binding protein
MNMEHKELARCSSRVLRIVLASVLAVGGPIAIAATAPPAQPVPVAEQTPAATGTLDRVRAAGKIVLGYRTAARPLSYADESGHAAGYAVTLCQKVADDIKVSLGISNLAVEWVTVSADAAPTHVQGGAARSICSAAQT